MTQRLLILLGTLLIAGLMPVEAARAGLDEEAFLRDLSALGNVESRTPGSRGYEESIDYLRREIRSLPGVALEEHSYHVMTPRTREATLSVGGQTARVYPFYPASVRLNATPEQGISGKLIYCGSAGYEQIPPASLAGQIAVIEASANDRWKTVAEFGAKAVIVLAGPEMTHVNFRSHEVLIPINIPRFYLADAELAGRIRRQAIGETATLRVSADWTRTRATNLYAYIAPRDAPALPAGDRRGNAQAWAALAIVTPVDATGLVYDLSPGASQAAQTAAALGMLRDFARHPPKRPVLVAFTGADSLSLQGTRQMLMALGDAPRKWRDIIDEQIDPELAKINQDIFIARRLESDPSRLKAPRDRTLIDRIVTLIETDIALEQDELFRLRVSPADQIDDAARRRVAELEARQIRLGQLKYTFAADPGKLSQDRSEAAHYLDRAVAQLGDKPGVRGLLQQWSERKASLQRRIDLHQWLARQINRGWDERHRRSEDPNPRFNVDRLIDLMVGLDLSDQGERCGPIHWGRFIYQPSITQIQEHREWFERLVERARAGDPGASWFAPVSQIIDFDPLKLTRTPLSYLGSPIGLPAEMGVTWGVPAFTMATLEDLRPRRDTPADTPANLKPRAIVTQAQAVHELLRHAWDDPTFLAQPEYRRITARFEGQVVSTASGKPIPDLPREGFLATYTWIEAPRKIPQVRNMPYAVGVRRCEVADGDSEGRYFFEGLPRLSDAKHIIVKTYQTQPGSGRITARTDLGKQSADLKQTVNLDEQITPLKSVVFNSQEITLGGLYDPRFLQGLNEVQLMDARRNAEPQRFDAMLFGRMFAGGMEPGSRAYLLFRYGRVGNRIILLNMPETDQSPRRAGVRGEGDGFVVEELGAIGPPALATARDFWRLNDARLLQYRKAGVRSALIDTMHAGADAQLGLARSALEHDRAGEMMKHVTGAWADEARVYDAARQMANDVIYAAIFLLLLSVPFAFCMERLLVGSANIYKQLAGAALIFALMSGALRLFHPAFKISSSPLVIILAFAIILMSMVVIGVVYSRFDVELKRLRSGRGAARSAGLARASVLMSAVMLGIANMRRRKFRTALTSITIVLITFAVLCFTSASQYQSTISLPTGVDAQYPGFMLRQRGFRAIPAEALDHLRAVYPDQTFVEHWWTVDANDMKAQVHLTAGGFQSGGSKARVASMQGLLGLTPGESRLSPIARVVGNFDRLEQGETDIIYLSQATADQLGIKVGQRLKLAGISLELAGTYDANDFDRRVTALSGESPAPLRYTPGALDAGGRKLTDQDVGTLDLDAGATAAEAGAAYEHLSSAQFAIVPARVSRRLDFTTLRSIGVRPASEDRSPASQDKHLKTMAEDLVRRFALATYAGYGDGVKLVSASNLSTVGGGSNVAIPLAIGGLIIFNTMMGSISERKREIHVYTSLGLAPLHVGALFLAEALTYGLIGSVFGYIIGQGVGTAMLKLGWLGNVTLNYSGSSAILTMGLILLIVLLSALVPARLAGRIAAPSIERSWHVPAPRGDEIVADLPFTINRTAAEGVVAYLAEFFEAHQEGSIGRFSAGAIDVFTRPGEDANAVRGIETTIWLTPFDLGVRQQLRLLIHPGQFTEIYEVQVILRRLSGDDRSWWRMNKTFLTELRQQFLQWRSLAPARMKEYIEESRRLSGEHRQSTIGNRQ